MRPAVSPTGPVLVPSAGSGVPLRAGAFVSVRILADLGGGFYRILAQGRELTASSTSPLVPGAIFRARAEAASRSAPAGSSLVLRILVPTQEKQANLLASLGLPGDGAARAALVAVLAEGLRPDAAQLGRIRKAILAGKSGDEGDRASLAARLEAKGLGATPEAVDLLEALSRGEGGSRTDEGGGPDGKQGKGLGRGRSQPGEEAGAEIDPGDPASLVAELASFLRSICERSGPKAGFLGLFNHTQGDEGELLIPFAFGLGSIAFRGSFRLHLPHISGGPVHMEGRFSTFLAGSGRESSSWGFVLDSEGRGRSRLALSPPMRWKASDFIGLEAALAPSGCRLVVSEGAVVGPPHSGVDLDA